MFQSKNYLESLVNLSCCLHNGQWENGGVQNEKTWAHLMICPSIWNWHPLNANMWMLFLFAPIRREARWRKKCIETQAHILCETSSSIWMWRARKKNILLLFNWLILYFVWLVLNDMSGRRRAHYFWRVWCLCIYFIRSHTILYLSCWVNWNGNSCHLQCAWSNVPTHHK